MTYPTLYIGALRLPACPRTSLAARLFYMTHFFAWTHLRCCIPPTDDGNAGSEPQPHDYAPITQTFTLFELERYPMHFCLPSPFFFFFLFPHSVLLTITPLLKSVRNFISLVLIFAFFVYLLSCFSVVICTTSCCTRKIVHAARLNTPCRTACSSFITSLDACITYTLFIPEQNVIAYGQPLSHARLSVFEAQIGRAHV